MIKQMFKQESKVFRNYEQSQKTKPESYPIPCEVQSSLSAALCVVQISC
jgi:hypothetical protein